MYNLLHVVIIFWFSDFNTEKLAINTEPYMATDSV